jgi:hypothetical protein
MSKYNVTVTRTAWRDFEVEADNKIEATLKAKEMASNHLWGDEDAEYGIEDIELIKSDDITNDVKECVYRHLREIVDKDYIDNVVDAIIDDVVADVKECADTNWSDGDVSFAISRVLSKKLFGEL